MSLFYFVRTRVSLSESELRTKTMSGSTCWSLFSELKRLGNKGVDSYSYSTRWSVLSQDNNRSHERDTCDR